MTWEEIKRAADDAGVKDDDEICAILCERREGGKTFRKTRLGNAVQLTEDAPERLEDYRGCAS